MPLVDPNDPQAERVYEWERACVETRVPLEVRSLDEMNDLVLEAAGFLGIGLPDVRTTNSDTACKAIPGEWAIEIAPWGRNAVTVLHEVAHLGTWNQVLVGEQPHGAAFVGAAIMLYSRFLGLDPDRLTTSAGAYGLAVRMHGNFRKPAPVETESFLDDDF